MVTMTMECSKCHEIKALTPDNFKVAYGRMKDICLDCSVVERDMKKREYLRNYKDTHPWYRAWKNANTRCLYDKESSYYKRGIEFNITVDEVKQIWMRDRADKMIEPSINRKNPDIGYHKDNCEFQELDKNKRGKKSTRFYNTRRDY